MAGGRRGGYQGMVQPQTADVTGYNYIINSYRIQMYASILSTNVYWEILYECITNVV